MIWNSTLKRRVPLKAKRALSPGKFNREHEKRKPLKKVSRARKTQMRHYFEIRNAFLAKPENQGCVVCTLLAAAGKTTGVNLATEVHHIRGRIGRLLCDERFFAGTCRPHREWPHENTIQARAWGILAGPHEWNRFPE